MSFRDGSFNNLKVPLTWAAAAAVVLALAAAVTLLMSDRRETLEATAYSPVRKVADTVQKPVNSVLSAPVRWVDSGVSGVRGYFFAVSENRRLRKKLEQMNDLKAQLALEKDLNSRYVAVLGLRVDPPVEMVSGRMISDSRGPFANSRLIDVGSDAGVKVGNPVMSENGLVGRIVGVSPKVSRVLLLTDVASRTPVMIDRTNARAILTGDGGGNPKLAYLRGQTQVGDVLVTSGDGGLFPRGLPVGVAVQGLDKSWRAKLSSDRGAIDFVRVLKFQDFAQLADLSRLSEVAKPQEMGAQMAGAVRPAAPAAAPAATQPKPAATAPAAPKVAAPPAGPAVPPAVTRPPGPAPVPARTPTTLPRPPAATPTAVTATRITPSPSASKAAAPPPAAPKTTAAAPAAKAAQPKAEPSYERAQTPDRPPVATSAVQQ